LDSRERVWKAVEFESPDRVPFEWYRHGVTELDVERSDLVWVDFNPLKEPGIEESGNEVRTVDEWGCLWVSYKSIPTMGQPLGHPLQDWSNIDDYEFPELEIEKRFEGVDGKVGHYRELGKYVVGSLDFGIWERLHFLRGLKETMLDLYLQRDRVHRLLEALTEFKIGLIRGYSGLGVDCVGFSDDWGSQSRLMISPELWVEVFKPHYERIFCEAERRGMHTFLHSCGNIRDIIGHLIEAGLGIIQLDAPHQSDVDALGEGFAGKICFDCCIDIQKVLVRGVRSEIDEEARRLTRRLGRREGGFIARQYPELVHIGVAPEVNEMAYEAFMKWSTYP
jgi:uroporphyrinogen decarboxylase